MTEGRETLSREESEFFLLQERRVCENTLHWQIRRKNGIPPTRRSEGVQPEAVGNRAMRRAAARRGKMKS